MATTFSTDRGIKNIGTGLEAGTWGASTNQNFERISDSLGRCVSLDITAMPLGSTSTTQAGAPGIEVEWVLLGASDSSGTSSEAGAEPRSIAVEFKDTFDALDSSTTPIINIRGGTSSVYANRMFIVFNNLGNSNSLKLAGGSSGDFTLLNGFAALVCSKVSTTGVWSLGVNGLLDDLQINNIVLAASTGKIEFVGTGTITLKDNSSTALVFNDGTDDLIKIDTTTGAKLITLDGDGDVTVDMSGAGTQTTTIRVHATDAEALKIWDNTDDCIVVDNSADEIKFGDAGTGKDIRVFGDVILSDQTSDIILKPATPVALEIADTSGNKYMNVLTTETADDRRFNSTVTFSSPDMLVTGTDGYINMNATIGSGGYGFRNNSGVMESRSSADAGWGLLYHTASDSGEGLYFQSTEMTLAADSGSTETHSLGGIPRIMTATMKCTSTDGGWASGDEIMAIDMNANQDANAGLQVYCTSTTVGFVMGNVHTVIGKSSFNQVTIDQAKWKLIIRAWK